MKYNPDVHHRKSIRLKGYDYLKEGIYYITIYTQNRECILENVGADSISAQIKLNNVEKMLNSTKTAKIQDYYLPLKYDIYI